MSQASTGHVAGPHRRRRFADRSVATKLGALVGVSSIMAAALLGVGLTGTAAVNGRAHAIYTEDLVPAGQLAGIRAGAVQAQRDLANLALAQDDAARTDLQARLADDDAALDGLVQKFTGATTTEQQRAELKQFTVWWDAYRATRDNFLLPLATPATPPTAPSSRPSTSATSPSSPTTRRARWTRWTSPATGTAPLPWPPPPTATPGPASP